MTNRPLYSKDRTFLILMIAFAIGFSIIAVATSMDANRAVDRFEQQQQRACRTTPVDSTCAPSP